MIIVSAPAVQRQLVGRTAISCAQEGHFTFGLSFTTKVITINTCCIGITSTIPTIPKRIAIITDEPLEGIIASFTIDGVGT